MSSWEVRGKLRGVWRLLLMSTSSLVGKASSTLQLLIMFNFHFLKTRKNTKKLANSWKITVPTSTLRKYLWYIDHIICNFIDELLNSTWKLVAFYFRGLRQNPGPCNLSRLWTRISQCTKTFLKSHFSHSKVNKN